MGLKELLPELTTVLTGMGSSFEVLVIDDGSTDGTSSVVRELALPHVRYLRLRRNSGKSGALAAGMSRAVGDVVILMDADGQDDPHEIPKLLDGLSSGLDLASGRRVDRQDRFTKRVASRFFNRVTATITRVPGRDMNTGFKAMRRDVTRSFELYGELHRFIPVLAAWNGFRVGEVAVNHRPRRYGESKFGSARFLRGFLDLITVKFITTYTGRPLHLFGSIGMVLGAAGAALLGWMLTLKLLGQGVGERPALLLGVVLVVVAVQIISLGLIAELLVSLRRHENLDAPIEEGLTLSEDLAN